MADKNIVYDEIELGRSMGILSVYQLSGIASNSACLRVNSNSCDNTGLRMYFGAYVACQFVTKHLHDLLIDKNVCEIGCGVGVLSVITARDCRVKSIILTDGNDDALELAAMNIARIKNINISTANLKWGAEYVDLFMATRLPYDIVLGSELMYYSIDVSTLLATVQSLLTENGLFFHAHIFRRHGSEQDLIDAHERQGWKCLEVPVTHFIAKEELQQQSEWYKVRCLVSGMKETLNTLLSNELFASVTCLWIPFQPTPPLYDSEGEEDQEDCPAFLFR